MRRPVDRDRNLRQHALNRGRNLGVFGIDDLRDLEGRLGIQFASGRIRLLGGKLAGVELASLAGQCSVLPCPLNRLHNYIVKSRANFFDRFVRAIGQVRLVSRVTESWRTRINPQRGTRIAQMSEDKGEKYSPIATEPTAYPNPALAMFPPAKLHAA